MGRVIMARVSMALVRSLVSRFSAAELKTKWDEAAAELELFLTGGVVVTGGSMKESSTQGELRDGNLELLVATYEQAYWIKFREESGETGTGGANRAMSHIDFSYRTWGF